MLQLGHCRMGCPRTRISTSHGGPDTITLNRVGSFWVWVWVYSLVDRIKRPGWINSVKGQLVLRLAQENRYYRLVNIRKLLLGGYRKQRDLNYTQSTFPDPFNNTIGRL